MSRVKVYGGIMGLIVFWGGLIWLFESPMPLYLVLGVACYIVLCEVVKAGIDDVRGDD